MSMKKKINEVIIVEGKHDLQRLKQVVDADILVSQGTHVSTDFLSLCQRMNETRGIIIFTDPDGPGEYIRRKIMDKVGNCKHASLSMRQAKTKQKVGIEHASHEDILDALEKVSSFVEERKLLSIKVYNACGLSGHAMSQERRNQVLEHFSLPQANGKTCFKYLNMIGVDDNTLIELSRRFGW